MQSNGKYSLLKIAIRGGKFHQIRTQLSLAGFPIVGDVKYGGEKWADEKAVALCATGLVFRAATENKKVVLEMNTPEEWQKWLSTAGT